MHTPTVIPRIRKIPRERGDAAIGEKLAELEAAAGRVFGIYELEKQPTGPILILGYRTGEEPTEEILLRYFCAVLAAEGTA